MIILMDIINIYMEKTTKKQKTYEWEFNFNLGDAAVIEKNTIDQMGSNISSKYVKAKFLPNKIICFWYYHSNSLIVINLAKV